jgi:two-component system, LuxR family, sensor kinase FixL
MAQSERRELVISAREDESMAEVSVADTGPGFPPEVRTRLFQPFVTTKQGGMGIGLSISRTLIQAQGGELSAMDNPTGGTVFAFTLPLADKRKEFNRTGRVGTKGYSSGCASRPLRRR